MATMLEILQQAEASANDAVQQARSLLNAGKPADAKKAINAGQAALRLAKSELTAQEREVRAQYQQARLDANKQGQTVGLFVNAKTRGQISRARAANKRKLAQKQQDALAPFASGKTALDRAIAELGSLKLEIDAGGGASTPAASRPLDAPPDRQSSPPPPPPPPPIPAQWSSDPTGRHELRYWDGVRWTEHIANNGEVGADPLGTQPTERPTT